MSVLRKLTGGLRALLRRDARNAEIHDELRAFVESSIDDKMRRGLNRDEAERAARAEIGSAEMVRHKVWSVGWESLAESIGQDIRYGIRQLRKSPGFALIAVASLTLGIGANTAIFSLLDALLLHPLPVPSPNQLLLFGTGSSGGSTEAVPFESWGLFSDAFFQDFRKANHSFSGIAAVDSSNFGVKASVAGSAWETAHVNLVSGNYFSVLGVPAFLGRTIGEADDGAFGSGPVAVASYSWFQRHLNGDPSALGKVIRIESQNYTLVGVVRPGFSGITVGQSTDLFIPISMEKAFSRPGWNGIGDKFFESLDLIGRLKPGVTPAQAGAETNLLFRQIIRSYLGPQPSAKHLADVAHASIELTPGGRGMSPLGLYFSLPLKILMAIVALVLLIACANIANMLLARGVARTRELAVRMALGASRRRIVVQLLTESAILAFLGAAAGIALAWKASIVLLHMATPGPNPLPVNLTPDARVLGFTLAVTVLTSILFGILPAFRSTKLEFTPALRDGRGSSSVATRGALARSLIVGQVALSVVLCVAAALFVRSLIHLSDVNTGFDVHNVLDFNLDSSTANLPHGPEEIHSVALQEQIEARVRAIHGVQSDSFSFFAFNNGGWSEMVSFQGVPRTPATSDGATLNITGNGFFSTMGIPLLQGRTFNAEDRQNSPRVAVINETMARRFFPTGSAVGKRFSLGETPDHPGEIEVIGVVKDAKYFTLDEDSQMAAYFPCTQSPGFYGNFLVRYAPGADKSALVAEVRDAIAATNPNILVDSVSSLEEMVDRSIATQALIAQLSGFFGILALFLACIGIYGLISYSVARRTGELGIRLALGAQSHALLWMILRECVLLLGIGLVIGVPVALSSTRVLKSLLFNLSPMDSTAISIAIAAVTAMTLAAAWLPARRATQIDPCQALRME